MYTQASDPGDHGVTCIPSLPLFNDMRIPKTFKMVFKTTVTFSSCQGWICFIDIPGGPDGPVGSVLGPNQGFKVYFLLL